jgi:hypothetical protein
MTLRGFRFAGLRGTFAKAWVAQLVEHILGKDEVISSILIMGSSLCAERGGARKLPRRNET